MRITGGRLRGRVIEGRVLDGVRPTSERVREAVFSALMSRDALAGARVLDLFTGTGALALEALSRDAESAVVLDSHGQCIKQVMDAARVLGLSAQVNGWRAEFTRRNSAIIERLRPAGPFGLVFADPPYDDAELVPVVLDGLRAGGLLAAGAWVVWEFASRSPVATPDGFVLDKSYRYGDTSVMLCTLIDSGENDQ